MFLKLLKHLVLYAELSNLIKSVCAITSSITKYVKDNKAVF